MIEPLLRKIAAGVYRTADDQFEIIQQECDIECENPHPGCPGHMEHTRMEWGIYRRFGESDYKFEPLDWKLTLREAKEFLSMYMRKGTVV